MATRSKRRRLANSDGSPLETATLNTLPSDPLVPSAPVTDQDRLRWKGFCEIESEPAFFNVMLRDFGVKGVRVHEVISLDHEMLAFLPWVYRKTINFLCSKLYDSQPVFGLIFLFKWRAEDPDHQESTCPDNIWFANQTVKDACASVALLNIVNNVPGLQLGEHLEHFKSFTADFTPHLRGDAIGNFEFIKNVHNSFARHVPLKQLGASSWNMDMLNADLQLKNDAAPRKGEAKGSNEEDAGFHFIAFVPVEGKVWKLDGLQRQPQNLGPVTSSDWVMQVAPEIESRMAQYEDGQIEFAILALVQEPLTKLVAALAKNVRSIASISQRLDQLQSDWRDFALDRTDGKDPAEQDLVLGPCKQYNLDQDAIDGAVSCSTFKAQLDGNKVLDLVGTRQDLITAQAGLRRSIEDEATAVQADNERAASRRSDKGLLAKGLVEVLERMGKSKSILGYDE
ncbi:MAG: hypothetical protein Q9183_000074 [Haloplaca sp. 2 TL-2023]